LQTEEFPRRIVRHGKTVALRIKCTGNETAPKRTLFNSQAACAFAITTAGLSR
jgi:hypothetical protein